MLSGCNCIPEEIEYEPEYIIVCEHPLELEFSDGSIATGKAAQYILEIDNN